MAASSAHDREADLDLRRQDLLLGWYADVGRDLPWRRTRDPYAVAGERGDAPADAGGTRGPRFEAWLERWPTAQALAEAPATEVLAAWSGLGYNSRALRLHAAAKAVAEQGWPSTEAGLRALPGIGPYTAGGRRGLRVPAPSRRRRYQPAGA